MLQPIAKANRVRGRLPKDFTQEDIDQALTVLASLFPPGSRITRGEPKHLFYLARWLKSPRNDYTTPSFDKLIFQRYPEEAAEFCDHIYAIYGPPKYGMLAFHTMPYDFPSKGGEQLKAFCRAYDLDARVNLDTGFWYPGYAMGITLTRKRAR